MNNCNCAACQLKRRQEKQGLKEALNFELSNEDKKEVKLLLTKILSKSSHETPKVRINKQTKEVNYCQNCGQLLLDGRTVCDSNCLEQIE